MTPDEIRKMGKRWMDNNRNPPAMSNLYDLADGSAQTAILVEIATQLAELKETLRGFGTEAVNDSGKVIGHVLDVRMRP